MKQVLKTIVFTLISFQIFAQIPANFQWLADGSGFRDVDDGEIIEVDGLAVTIAFLSGQTKKLNAEYAHLQKL